jgi:formylglycine-generating enzyme
LSNIATPTLIMQLYWMSNSCSSMLIAKCINAYSLSWLLKNTSLRRAARKQTWEELQASKNGEQTASTYKYDARGAEDEEMEALYGKTTLVNNKSRVYKGGSWNDRPYWLNPATRRFMQQDESDAMTGFRCAMTMVGNVFGPASQQKKARRGSAH